MQLANSTNGRHSTPTVVRMATQGDARGVQQLIRDAAFVHIHADWHVPGDWLGERGFMLHLGRLEAASGERQLEGCLVIAADPPPAAWVRVAVTRPEDGYPILEGMMTAALANLDPEIDEVAWFVVDEWPESWLANMGFRPKTEVITLEKNDLTVPPFASPSGLEIRPVRPGDFPALADIEAEAFEPIWRHSAEGLHLAWRQSVVFDVALEGDRPVGFQFSTRTFNGAHVARMTVHPGRQQRGIGAALLAEAIHQFEAKNLNRVSLNTQIENMASQKLYKRFGFVESGQSFPVWTLGR